MALKYLGRIITNDARYTREIKPRMAMAKAAFNKKTLFATKLDLNLRKKLVKSLLGSETWTLQKVDQKQLEKFEMRCWRRMEITWTDRVTNELERVKKKMNILRTVHGKKEGQLAWSHRAYELPSKTRY
jgi:hypothetical protein